MSTIHLLSGGAAQGLINKLKADFERRHGCSVQGTFGAVGLMKDGLLRGDKCDVLILSQKLIDELADEGRLLADSARPIGSIRTGVAVREGDDYPLVADASQLREALLKADGVYFPDPQKATAGIHFMNVLRKLGVETEIADRLRPYPNGATAMKALAQSSENRPIGCTQISEILSTPGVRLVAPLPEEFALATVYTAAIPAGASEPAHAKAFIEFLTSKAAAQDRRAAGIE